jgi:leucyl-tRNA synthetase
MAAQTPDYDFTSIERHWQSRWEQERPFTAEWPSSREKFYVLDMFPYPSGAGLHLGHCENYTITDVLARFQRARGKNVLYPIGWDAFGLPTEQYAVKTGRRPAEVTLENVATFRRQLKSIGISYDFGREVNTTDPGYYRWTQWIFLQLFKRGLAYVEEKPVWWCPALGTVLANEEVIDGKSEVGGFPVERRPIRQWVLRITAYAERLLKDLPKLDWPDSTKRMQEAWIGRSEGTEIEFGIDGLPNDTFRIFTTRVDTLFGVTFMVIAPEHPLLPKLVTPAQREAVSAYAAAAASKSDLQRTDLAKDKTGVFTGAFAIHPFSGKRIPIWVADYVLMSYGTGAIMAVPAHDQRDYEFAQTYNLPIQRVIEPADHSNNGTGSHLPFLDNENGILVHSSEYTGLSCEAAREAMTAALLKSGRGRGAVQYKLRDWLFARQRYWGEPFPLVWVSEEDYAIVRERLGSKLPLAPEAPSYIDNGKRLVALPLPESALPLTLPDVASYQPAGTGESPLAAVTDWLEIWYDPATGAVHPASQPKPESGFWIRARRETNTMPQWAGSCWYYLRYLDPHNQKALADPELLHYWGVPDLYVGGAEHAVLHLLYARFWHKVLFDCGVVPQDEPFTKLFHQGLILGEDGEKMSKSRGNVVNPDDVIAKYGCDTLRVYLMFLGPLEAKKPWNPKGIEGPFRFLRRVFTECCGEEGRPNPRLHDGPETDTGVLKALHATVKKVTEDIEGLRYNTAISALMVLLNRIQEATSVAKATLRTYCQLIAPFAPHLAEECWSRLGGEGLICRAQWPVYDPALLVETTEKLVVQINGKHRGEIVVPKGSGQDAALAAAREIPKVAEGLAAGQLRKVIHVPGRILNLVVS